MARVPVATSQVQSRAAPVVYQNANGATADAFGASQAKALAAGGQQLMAAGNMVGDHALKMQIEDNERDAKKADVEFSQTIRAITVGDDQAPGYYSQRGQGAIDAHKSTEKAIDEARRKHMEGIQNPRVREMFGTVSMSRVERAKDGMSRHAAKERRVANDAVSEARLGEAMDDAGAAWNDPRVIAQAAAVARIEVQDMAERNGWAPEVTLSKMQEANTALHRKVIDAAIVHDPAYAEKYFKANKDKMDGRVHAEISKALEAGTLRQQSQEAADGILASAPDEKTAMELARAIKDPKLRDETVARVQRRYAENDRVKRAEDRQRKEKNWAHVLGGGSLDDVSPTELAAMDGTTVSAMRTFEKKRAKDGRGFADATDPATYNTLHNLYMQDKAAFASYDITQHIGKMDESDYQYWLSQQRSIDKAAEKDKARATSYTLADRIAKEYLTAANIDYGASAKPKNAAKSQKVFSLIRGIVDTLAAEGKPATKDDIERGLNDLFLSGEITDSGTFWNTSGRKFEFQGTPEAARFVITDVEDQAPQIAQVTGVPVEHVVAIVGALEKKKIAVTAANIQKLWETANRGK